MDLNSNTRKDSLTRTVLGQPSWRVASDQVEAFVTEVGGHVGPVTFDRRGRKLQPYSVAPWAGEYMREPMPRLLEALRGDFFCLPFGGNAKAFRGEQHPVHGETANMRWKFEGMESRPGLSSLHLSQETKVRPGRVDKRIILKDDEDVVYSEHVVSGMRGPMSVGHHAMLKFPDEPGSGLIATSPFVYGQVFPFPFELPENKGYSWLKPGAEFESLQAVPGLDGEAVDVSRYPARRGWEDLLLLVSDADQPFAWTAVTFPKERFVWFALKDPKVLRETVFWISNGGRHYIPWNGKHVNVMGLEEITGFFHMGVAESAAKNTLNAKGFPTCITFDPRMPTAIRYIMGVATVPSGFNKVAAIEPTSGRQEVVLRSQNGKRVQVRVDLSFLNT